MNMSDHISVCICTYRRGELLRQLLERLRGQRTDGLFSYSIVVSDNDCLQSAKELVSQFTTASSTPAVVYCVEPMQNIALARNRALKHAEGNFIAFIDDDEFPSEEWLWNLFATFSVYGAAGVLGPVRPYFLHQPPGWVVKGKFCERPTYRTGHVIDWRQSRTGNVLFKKEILNGLKGAFRPQFASGGEDVDFFERMARKGYVFVWCNEADVFEVVPQARCSRMYFLRRALLRGRNTLHREGHRVLSIGKSLIAISVYGLGLPILFVVGHHHFMKYLIKLCDHAGKILAIIGLNPVKVRGA
jgi:glycosyltransferase involved in cell wall biosynthesis